MYFAKKSSGIPALQLSLDASDEAARRQAHDSLHDLMTHPSQETGMVVDAEYVLSALKHLTASEVATLTKWEAVTPGCQPW